MSNEKTLHQWAVYVFTVKKSQGNIKENGGLFWNLEGNSEVAMVGVKAWCW